MNVLPIRIVPVCWMRWITGLDAACAAGMAAGVSNAARERKTDATPPNEARRGRPELVMMIPVEK